MIDFDILVKVTVIVVSVSGFIILLHKFPKSSTGYQPRINGNYNPKPPGSRPDVSLAPPRIGQSVSTMHVEFTEEMFKALEAIEPVILRLLVLQEVKTGLTREQYNFFTAILTEHLNYMMMKATEKETAKVEKTNKFKWIQEKL